MNIHSPKCHRLGIYSPEWHLVPPKCVIGHGRARAFRVSVYILSFFLHIKATTGNSPDEIGFRTVYHKPRFLSIGRPILANILTLVHFLFIFMPAHPISFPAKIPRKEKPRTEGAARDMNNIPYFMQGFFYRSGRFLAEQGGFVAFSRRGRGMGGA